jgi:uncharacterized protein (TIGR02117 family)
VVTSVVLSLVGTNPVAPACGQKVEVFVTTNGLHLDIVFPRNFMNARLLAELGMPEEVQYVSFGWGDRGFYLETPTWTELELAVAMKAIFLRSETAMHVTHYFRKQSDWQSIWVCPLQVDQLIDYVVAAFARDSQGNLVKISGATYTGHDWFYEALGTYTLITTCNHWVCKALKQADIQTSIWSPFDFGVIYHVKRTSLNDLKG